MEGVAVVEVAVVVAALELVVNTKSIFTKETNALCMASKKREFFLNSIFTNFKKVSCNCNNLELVIIVEVLVIIALVRVVLE